MASRKTPKIASPGATEKPAKGKKPTVEVPAAKLEDLAPGSDPSAFVARLCPVDIPGAIKILGRYVTDRDAFKKVDEDAKSKRGTMNATKKELVDKGFEKDAISFAMKLSDMDPEFAQKVLAQTFVLCRSKVLDVPLGVVNGTSGDLFDPDRVYRFGKLNSEAATTETKLTDPATIPAAQTDEERRRDLYDNGRSMGLRGLAFAPPKGVPPTDAAAMHDGWLAGDKERRGDEAEPGNVVPLQTKPAPFSTVGEDDPLPEEAAANGIG